MDIPVLIEPIGPTKFRATVFQLSAEAATADDALARVRDELHARLKAGARVDVIPIPLPDSEREFPLRSAAGILKDHPLLNEWLEAMAENRRRVDADAKF